VNNFKSNYDRRGCIYIILSAALFILSFSLITGCSKKSPAQPINTKVFVLDDSNDNSVTQKQEYNVLMLDKNCKLLKKVGGFKVKGDLSKQKVIAVSEDNRLFAVCEDAANELSIYETSTGKEYKSITWPERNVNSAIFFKDKIYAVNQTIALAIDFQKGSFKEINTFWDGPCYDFIFDKKNNCFWTVGLRIIKYDMNFKSLFEVDEVFDRSIARAFSVDVTSDGSIWAAIREITKQNGAENKLVKISTDGDIIETIPVELAPVCICIDKSDNSIWVTGIMSDKDYTKIDDQWPETLSELHETVETDVKTFTHKYNSRGELIVESDKGGYSIDIDSSDKSVWIAGYDSIIHCSSNGDIISEYKDVSNKQKWITVVK
jgi:DNA-binding beta-propeller fold protein YncE